MDGVPIGEEGISKGTLQVVNTLLSFVPTLFGIWFLQTTEDNDVYKDKHGTSGAVAGLICCAYGLCAGASVASRGAENGAKVLILARLSLGVLAVLVALALIVADAEKASTFIIMYLLFAVISLPEAGMLYLYVQRCQLDQFLAQNGTLIEDPHMMMHQHQQHMQGEQHMQQQQQFQYPDQGGGPPHFFQGQEGGGPPHFFQGQEESSFGVGCGGSYAASYAGDQGGVSMNPTGIRGARTVSQTSGSVSTPHFGGGPSVQGMNMQNSFGLDPPQLQSVQGMNMQNSFGLDPPQLQSVQETHFVSPPQMQVQETHYVSPPQLQVQETHYVSPPQMQVQETHYVSPPQIQEAHYVSSSPQQQQQQQVKETTIVTSSHIRTRYSQI
eukprot:TRINITY_DN9412_c0_g1_i4.p1 TRINITY_DN9412_c0_g1~~TRINITY_DN9412_c0_g1_i4.p1  ORF type:complete len:390 (-),score=86.14 TRINITY_DN9412_c0_g1_i4:70-1218(-)